MVISVGSCSDIHVMLRRCSLMKLRANWLMLSRGGMSFSQSVISSTPATKLSKTLSRYSNALCMSG